MLMDRTSSLSVTTAAVSFDLTTLATVKDDLQIADAASDTTLSRYITEQSALIASYCNRVFAVESVSETIYLERDPYPYQVPGGCRQLQLSRWPLLSVSSVVQTDGGNSTTLTPYPGTTSVPADYQIMAPEGQLIRLDSFGEQMAWPAVMYQVAYQAGFVAPVDAWAASTQYVYNAVRSNGGNLYVCTVPGASATSGGPTGTTSGIVDGTATWNYVGPVQARTLPYDLEMAVLKCVVARYLERSRDPFLKETEDARVGRKVYWVGTMPGRDGPFTPEVMSILDRYRVPVVA